MKRSGTWLCAAGLVLLFAGLRWNSVNIPLVRDEGEYAYAAQILTRGLPPYERAFLQKPPMVIYSYALAHVMAPHEFWFPRVVAYLFVALATALLGLIARLEFGPGYAWPAMWFLTPMVVLPGIEQFTANTEMFMLLPLLGMVAMYALSRRSPRRWACALVAGALGATTFWFKYTALPVLAVVVVAWSIRDGQTERRAGLMFRNWLLGSLGAAAASLAILACFLARDGGQHLWECTVAFNRFYAGSSTFDRSGLPEHLRAFWSPWWILFLLLPALAMRAAGGLAFWIAMFLAAWLATDGSVYGHYYIVVMPFWALLTAVAVNRLASWSATRRSRPRAWLTRVLTGFVVALICLPQWHWMTRSRQAFAADKLEGDNPFMESVPVARRVAELTSPSDYVYVAGSEPEILDYAQRLSPTRFVIAYPLMIPTPLAQGFQLEAIRDLEHRPPSVIVLARSNTSWMTQPGSPRTLFNYLGPLMASHYQRIGGFLFDGPTGHWTEPLPDQDLTRSSLVLFKRRGN